MKISAIKELTRIEQSLFGLPFVLSGALLSLVNPHTLRRVHWTVLVWVLPAFFLARMSGMAFNQLIDRHIDSRNPRTQNRPIPSGRVNVNQARIVAWGSLSAFVWVCFQINTLCALLSLFAALLIYIYSYMKRVHASCHFVLGIIHFLGPVMAYVAFQGSLSFPSIFLGLVALCSIIGNDICYAIQDYAFDCKQHLFSLPSRFGVEKSLKLAFGVHFLSLIFLVAVGLGAHLPFVYYLVVPIVGSQFFRFHFLLRRQLHTTGVIQGIEKQFFLSNVVVSFSSFIFILLSMLWVVLS